MFKKAFKLLLILLILPFLLVLVYAVVPPLSIPVVGTVMQFEKVHWQWKPYSKISGNLPRMVISAEDGRFCEHDGVDWIAVEKVVNKAQKKKKLTHGASTIPMQTVKNLFLWHLPKFVRKPLEIPLAMWADLVWSKQRMMEIYLNIAQFGDNIYGAEAAAQYYFKKPASKLTASEAAVLAAVLPAPEKRKANKPSKYTGSYAAKIKGRAGGSKLSCLR